MDSDFFLKIVKPYTMTSNERIKCLYDSLEYVRLNNIEGDIVECGVWKGGNILGSIEYLKYYGMKNKVWLYDTFSGMTKPTNFDVDLNGKNGFIWENKCDSSLSEVENIISKTNYKNVKYVVGDILTTLDDVSNVPESISILRLDTDWYESTKKEMEVLYPKLTKNGVLIVDDYGHWSGCKKAIDDHFKNCHLNFKYKFIDYTGVIHYKE